MKNLIIFIILIFVLFLSGCTEPSESYAYVKYEGKQFIKQSEGVYKNENDYVYYNEQDGKTVITMTFSDVHIDIHPGKDPMVIYPDGCMMYVVVKDGLITGYGPGSIGHFHDFTSFATLTFEQIDNSAAEKAEERLSYISILSILIVICIFTSFFVFKPNNVRHLIILKNSILPLHEEPYEPTDLNVGLNYISFLTVFIGSVIIIFIILDKIF